MIAQASELKNKKYKIISKTPGVSLGNQLYRRDWLQPGGQGTPPRAQPTRHYFRDTTGFPQTQRLGVDTRHCARLRV